MEPEVIEHLKNIEFGIVVILIVLLPIVIKMFVFGD